MAMQHPEDRQGPVPPSQPPSPPRRAPKRTTDQVDGRLDPTPFSTSVFRIVRLSGDTVRVIHSLAYDERASAEWNGRRLGLSPVEVDALESGIRSSFVPHLLAKRVKAQHGQPSSLGEATPGAARATKKKRASMDSRPLLDHTNFAVVPASLLEAQNGAGRAADGSAKIPAAQGRPRSVLDPTMATDHADHDVRDGADVYKGVEGVQQMELD